MIESYMVNILPGSDTVKYIKKYRSKKINERLKNDSSRHSRKSSKWDGTFNNMFLNPTAMGQGPDGVLSALVVN